MKNLGYFLIIVLGIVLVMASCKDEEPSVVGTWILTAATLDSAGTGNIQDIYANEFEACNRDDRFLFGSDLSYEQHEGPTACAGRTPNQTIEQGAYTYASTSMTLTVSFQGGGLSGTVTFSGNTMTLTDVERDGTTLVFTFTRA
jgi:hypothetical protein